MELNRSHARIRQKTITQTRIHLNASRLNARRSF
jgi:hypothetical protein